MTDIPETNVVWRCTGMCDVGEVVTCRSECPAIETDGHKCIVKEFKDTKWRVCIKHESYWEQKVPKYVYDYFDARDLLKVRAAKDRKEALIASIAKNINTTNVDNDEAEAEEPVNTDLEDN